MPNNTFAFTSESPPEDRERFRSPTPHRDRAWRRISVRSFHVSVSAFANRPWHAWAIWIVALTVTTVLLLAVRTRVNEAHVAMAYLLVVQGASAFGGRRVGLAIVVLAFLAFDVFFVPPYGTLAVDDPLDWAILAGFL